MKNTEKNIVSYDHLFNGLHQFVDSDGHYWYSATKAASLIGLKNPLDTILRYVSEENRYLFKRKQFCDNVLSYYNVENAGEVLISKDGLLQLLMFCNSLSLSQKHEFAKKFGLEIKSVSSFTSNPSYKFICNLQEILEYLGIHSIKEYKILHEYKVDLYVPKYKLAIEYYDNLRSNDKIKELALKEVLNCDFIRLYYMDSDNKNIAKAINKILKIEKVIL